jgi:phosphoserine aminotransferase
MSCRYNFSAGPAILPKEVLKQVQSELIDWHGTGMSVIEMSHRGKQYLPILDEAENDLRNIFSIPKNYKVLFLQGGAITQNFMVPMNLLAGRSASYVASGYWSKRTYNDAQPFENIHLAASSESIDFIKAPDASEWKYSSSDAYIHFCMNETIHGVEYFDVPESIKVPLVCDMSSNILSRPMDIDKFGVIYAGAQKNIGPAGLTLLIVREDLIDFADKKTPTTFNWKIQSDNKSMINTPSTFSIYVAGLVFKWIEKNGGLKMIEKKNIEKADYLYKYIDSSSFYYNNIDKNNRSRMNVPFRIHDDELTMKFVAEAEEQGLYQLKGHRLVGGLRASIYNAMPMEGVEALVEFMEIFEKKYQ